MGAALRALAPPCNKLCRIMLTASIRGILFNQRSAWPQVIGAFIAASHVFKGAFTDYCASYNLDTVSRMFVQIQKMNINDNS